MKHRARFSRRSLIRIVLGAAGLAICMPLSSLAQTAAPAGGDKKAAIKETIAKNQAALKQYSWVETTTTSINGEVKKQEEQQCAYGPDGKVQKTPVAGAPPPQQQDSGGRRGGRLKEKIVEKKKGEIKDYMEEVSALIKEYVPPDPQKIQAAEAAGNVTVQPAAQGPTLMTIKNYVKEGDSLSLGFDAQAKKLDSYDVSSYVEKPSDDPVTLGVTFSSLDDGTRYPQQILLHVPAKKIDIKIVNSGYKKIAM
jgi:hypothetical protein